MRILYLPHPYSQQRQRQKKANIYPVRMAMEAQWHRQNGDTVHWSDPIYPKDYYDVVLTEPEGLDFLSLPMPDRVFTQAKHYTSGNYKYLPGTHMQVADGCWHGKCTFCVEKGRGYKVRPVDECIAELYECKRLGFKEVFDDSGTFPTGRWLTEFCEKTVGLGLHLGCNMRMVDVDYHAMRKSGFRMVLFGLESANQYTLDKINKGVKVEDTKYIIQAASAGLECHLTAIFGYPWEDDKDALHTLHTVHTFLKKGYAKTAQASFYCCPTDSDPNESHRKYIRKIYNAALSPEFWFHQIKTVKTKEDLLYLWKGIKSCFGR
jgi:anaerobic magnesium-protoporphyrin IX monomethyl ester cyclase